MRILEWYRRNNGYRKASRPIPRRSKLTQLECDKVKSRIRHRLDTEDYTCRLPRLSKPRVRYKLRLKGHVFFFGKYFWQYERVYK